MQPHYNRAQLADALKQVGVQRGDVVFSHSNVGYFGYPEEGSRPAAVFQVIVGALQDVLGPEGTLVVPTFTYSFCKQQPFDPDETPSTCGVFTEMLRKHPRAQRSHDPIFSVAALGARAQELVADIPAECFGPGSFWDRFLRVGGIICNLNFDAGSTFVHYVERCLNVPYRYDKLFTGQIAQRGTARKAAAIFFSQDLSNADTVAAFEAFDTLARQRGVACTASVGRGAVVGIRASEVYRLIEDELRTNPWLLTAAGKTGKAPVLLQPAETARFRLQVRKNASVDELVSALWRLPRDIVSDGYDAALQALAQQVPMTIHEYPTGTTCWTWLVPEKWVCNEAYLENTNGKRIFSYGDHPLHVVSYSLPFESEVSRAELFDHLHVHPRIPSAVPFKFKYYERDWGLCCSQEQKDALTEDRYKVVIKTSFSYGTLKVGEVVVPGASEQTVVLCVHLCHPHQANDDLSGVVVGVDVMRALLRRPTPRYTYRLLIVPETIGSVAYLSQNEALIPKMKGGLFLEMLGLSNPHALQLSFEGNTELDECFASALGEHDAAGWTAPFRTVIGNDERQFNGPGVRVPMLSLSRVLPRSDPDWPYREYHSSHDTPERLSARCLEESRDLVLRMIDRLESSRIPVNRFKGEVFCSRFGLHIDFYTNPEGNRALFDIMNLIDGTRSVTQIAEACGISLAATEQTIAELCRHGLVDFEPAPSDG